MNLWPLPTLHSVWFLNIVVCCWWFNYSRPFHQEDKWLLLLVSCRALHPPYLDIRILLHRSPCCWNSSHFHFPSNAVLKARKSFMPRPPLSLGRHTVFQLTQAIFRCSKSPPHKNLRWMLTSLSTTLSISLYECRLPLVYDVRHYQLQSVSKSLGQNLVKGSRREVEVISFLLHQNGEGKSK